MLTQKQIGEHYTTPEIRDTIMRISSDGGSSRAGNGDFSSWYKYVKGKKLKFNLSNKFDYTNMVLKYRTLYWTLNLFDPEIFKLDYGNIKYTEKPIISRQFTKGYTLGIDIDKGKGCDIHDPAVKKAVEDMAQYFCSRLREFLPNSVYAAFSGGGIYILVHHRVFTRFFDKFDTSEERDLMIRTLLDAFDHLIGDIRDQFFKLYPEHKGKVKPDQLNNSQRIFKTIFSIHKKSDYCVIPLNPDKIEIDFEAATIPLKPSIIEVGNSWYTKFDDGKEFLSNCLKAYLQKAYDINKNKRIGAPDIDISKVPLADINKWAPCMRNLYNLPTCGEGKTRALSIFASYIGQIGIPEPEARDMFFGLAQRWEAETSNIFESYYRRMHTPSCRRLTSDDNRGFPKGVSLKALGFCTPDLRCVNISSPRYYTDKGANIRRLLFPKS